MYLSLLMTIPYHTIHHTVPYHTIPYHTVSFTSAVSFEIANTVFLYLVSSYVFIYFVCTCVHMRQNTFIEVKRQLLGVCSLLPLTPTCNPPASLCFLGAGIKGLGYHTQSQLTSLNLFTRFCRFLTISDILWREFYFLFCN